MLRQLNVKRQLTIPALLAKRLGFSGKGWVHVLEQEGVLIITPATIKSERAKPLALLDKDWVALNRKVRAELKAGKGKSHAHPQAFLDDLRRRIRKT